MPVADYADADVELVKKRCDYDSIEKPIERQKKDESAAYSRADDAMPYARQPLCH